MRLFNRANLFYGLISFFVSQTFMSDADCQSFNYPKGIHLKAGASIWLPLLSTGGDYINASVPTPAPTIILEGNWEINSDITIGYDFKKWNVSLQHRFHKYTPDSIYLISAPQLDNPTVFKHHDLGILIGRNIISRKARLHQIGLGFTRNNIGSSYSGYDANQNDIYPAAISNQYNSFSFQYARQLLKPTLTIGSKWFNHFFLKFSADYALDIPLQSVITEHNFFRFGLGLQYQISSLWQNPVVPVKKNTTKKVSRKQEPKEFPLKLTAGIRIELPISAFNGNIMYYNPASDYEYNQFTIAPTAGVRYYLDKNRLAFTYVPGLKKTVLNFKEIPDDYTGGQFGAAMKYGKWVVDQHFDFQWFSNGYHELINRRKPRRALGLGLSVMNPFASYTESSIPEAMGQEISLTYFTYNLICGFELGAKGFGKGLFIEPRIMFIPKMPDYSVAEQKLRVMTGLRIYKEINLRK